MTQGAHHRATPVCTAPTRPGYCSCRITAIAAAPPPHPPYITPSPQTPPFSHIIPYASAPPSRLLPPVLVRTVIHAKSDECDSLTHLSSRESLPTEFAVWLVPSPSRSRDLRTPARFPGLVPALVVPLWLKRFLRPGAPPAPSQPQPPTRAPRCRHLRTPPAQTERNHRIRGKPFLTASNALTDYSELPTPRTSRERIEGVSRSLP